MVILQGVCKNVFLTPQGVNKETGEAYGGKYKVQIEVENELMNGQTRFDLEELYTDQDDAFRKLIGRPVSVPVSPYVYEKKVRYRVRKGKVSESMEAAT